MTAVDLRSDTATRPSAGMRKAMAEAEVGDIQYGEDPCINRLQARVAEMLGKEAALWLPSGTQSNQVALLTLTQRGDEVIVSREAHAAWHEAGGSAFNAGVQLVEIGDQGVFTADEMVAAIKPDNIPVFPHTTLVQVENTHNRMGGVVVPQDEIERICTVAREHGLNCFLDGARLWNAAEATGLGLDTLAKPFDLVTVAFSKGLGGPVGSVLAGPKDLIEVAERYRRMLGGAMRQIGMLAAASEYALDNNLSGLADDHANARMLGETLAKLPMVDIDLDRLHTNIVVMNLSDDAPEISSIIKKARAEDILIGGLGPRTMRAVTHLDVTAEDCARAASVLTEAFAGI
jgi:threonine aldolase